MELPEYPKYKINDLEGFSITLGYLVCMMMHTRRVTLESVKGLSVAELDYQLDGTSNSIGALLAHIAATERWYQAYSFEQRVITGAEFSAIEAALDLGERGRSEINGCDLTYYLEELQVVRAKTLRELKSKDDTWLFEDRPFAETDETNNFYMWYHVFEDEINHRGQINWIKKRISR